MGKTRKKKVDVFDICNKEIETAYSVFEKEVKIAKAEFDKPRLNKAYDKFTKEYANQYTRAICELGESAAEAFKFRVREYEDDAWDIYDSAYHYILGLPMYVD